MIIDDPVKSRAEADCETVRERVGEWFRADLLTRLKPGAKIVLVMTRWHEDDLGGRLLAEMDAGGRRWEVLSCRWRQKQTIRSAAHPANRYGRNGLPTTCAPMRSATRAPGRRCTSSGLHLTPARTSIATGYGPPTRSRGVKTCAYTALGLRRDRE